MFRQMPKRSMSANFFWLTAALLLVSSITFVSTVRRARAAGTLAYTVSRTEQVFDQNGTLKFTHSYVDAVRSDGARMWRGTTGEQQARGIYFANGDYVRTSELTGRKSTYPKAYSAAPARRDPAASCVAPEEAVSGWRVAGEDTIGGYRAVRVVKSTPQQVITIWYAMDVGCAPLQSWFQHENGITKQNFTALVPGEPDLALFQVSPALTEGPPSMLPCSSGQNTCSVFSPAAAQHEDSRYNSANSR
jgi:hypothetical protein